MDKRKKERIADWAMRCAAYLVVLAVAYIVLHIVWNGLPAMNWTFLSTFPTDGGAAGGIFPAILGTFLLVTGTISAALPLGIACAVYLSEYARQNLLTRAVRLAIVTLAGIPSIVFGLFGYGIFVIALDFRPSILSGSLTLACMVLPTIIVASEEALRAVPQALREGSLALGATQWQAIYTNVLPYAVPGMVTGSILAIGRAAGETAPILLTAAAFMVKDLPTSVYSEIMALPYHLYILATQHPDASVRPQQYGTALALLLLVLGVNVFAVLIRYHFRKKYRW